MIRKIQLDEGINAGHLERACIAEGLIEPLRFPRNMRGKGAKDPEVMQSLFPKGNLIVTLDEGFVEDHIAHVQAKHPGVFIISDTDDAPDTMDSHKAQSILREFKDEYPDWHIAPWSNSVIRITPRFVYVWHVKSHVLVRNLFLNRTDSDWQKKLSQELTKNAAR